MMQVWFLKKQTLAVALLLCVGVTVMFSYLRCHRHTHYFQVLGNTRKADIDTDKVVSYDRNLPLIFIGGVPRSGTTLMRAMLDAHSMVRCGKETRLVPRILGLRSQWLKSTFEKERLIEAGIDDDVINDAIRAFILEIIVKHGEPAPRLCNKDPFSMRYSQYLSKLFPNAKFIFMIRDGRAVVHSIISRKVSITGYDLNNFKQCLTMWNVATETMFKQCRELSTRCLPIHYEQLVLQPQKWLRKITKFLDIPWEDTMLHHQDFVNKKGGVSLSKLERSSDQVMQAVYYGALTRWVGHVPDDVMNNMDTVAPMLSRLGYDPWANPPKYGDIDVISAVKPIKTYAWINESQFYETN